MKLGIINDKSGFEEWQNAALTLSIRIAQCLCTPCTWTTPIFLDEARKRDERMRKLAPPGFQTASSLLEDEGTEKNTLPRKIEAGRIVPVTSQANNSPVVVFRWPIALIG